MANALTPVLSRFEQALPPRRTLILYGLYTGGLFLLFLVLTFPHDLLARRYASELTREAAWRLRFDDVHLVPWSGYRFSDLRVLPGDLGDPWLTAPELTIRPSLASLFGGGLSAGSFRGETYGGRVSGWVSTGERTAFEIRWEDVALAEYPRLTSLVDGRWGGSLSGELRLQVQESLRDAEGDGKLSLRNASLVGGNAGGFTVPDLTSTQGDGEFAIKAGRLEIRTLKLTGAEIDADLHGQIYLRRPLSQSVINATLNVKPVPGAPAGIEGLLTLLNRGQKAPAGTYTLTLYGMLERMRVR